MASGLDWSRNLTRATLILLLLSATPVIAQVNNEIGVFASEDGTTSDTTMAVGEPFELYVCLHMNGYRPNPNQCQDPAVAVSLRIVGVPDSWSVSFTSNPDALYSRDNPLTEAGGKIIVPIGDSSSVNLYTLRIEDTEKEETAQVDIMGQGDGCPTTMWIAANCDGAPVCLAGTIPLTISVVAASTPTNQSTWSRIKVQYLGK